MIKLVVQGAPSVVQKEAEQLKKFLSDFEIFGYPILTQTNKNRLTYGLLIRLDADGWPNERLVEKLRALPQYIKVVVQADNIF
jgi:hypothetical protein